MPYRAVHLPGGNPLDDVRLDVEASFAAQDGWLRQVPRSSAKRSRIVTGARRVAYRLEPLRVREALVNAGIRRGWLDDFRGYWDEVVRGRPLTVMDFHNLRFAYRLRAQTSDTLAWSTPGEHLANWQAPSNLFQTFDFVYQSALRPARDGTLLFQLLRPGWRILEYGCGLAPMYATWRKFMSHMPTRWVLADVPGFAFHYARHAYARDAEVEFVTIRDLADPLDGADGPFDLIVMQTVFEHVDHPRRIAEYLLDRLGPGGLFWFDYINSEGKGLDTPGGVVERRETLAFLSSALDTVHGELAVSDRSLTTYVGAKRARPFGLRDGSMGAA